MFGFLIGTLSLIGLYKVTRGGWGGPGRGRWGRGGWMLRGLFHRLETTPGQERVISDSFEAMRGLGRKLRGESEKLRRDVAQAMRAQTLDHEPLKAAFLRHDAMLEELQRETLVSLGKIHEALDERQREQFAQLVEDGWHGHGHAHGWGHHRRCGAGHDPRYAAQSL